MAQRCRFLVRGAMLLAADGVARLAGVAPDALGRATVPMPETWRLIVGAVLCAGAIGFWARTLPPGGRP